MDRSEKDSQADPGEVIWEFAADNSINSSAVVADGFVYVTDRDDNLVAVDVDTGNWEWYFEMDTGVFGNCSPTVVNETLYIGSGDGNLYAINANSGDKQWEFATEDKIKCQPIVSDDSVYFANYSGYIYSVDATHGTGEWRTDLTSDGDVVFKSSVDVSDKTVYVGSPDNNLYALDAATGTQVWAFETRGTTTSTPVAADDTVYIGSRDTNLYAVDTATGTEKWHFKTRGEITHSSPAVGDGTVYVGSSDCSLYAIDADNGTKKWEFETQDWIMTPPRLENDMVYVGSKDHNLYAVDAGTGVEEWHFRAGDRLSSLSHVFAGVIYAGSQDNTLYAIATGRQTCSITAGLQNTTSADSEPGSEHAVGGDSDRNSLQTVAALSRSEMKQHLQEMDPYEFEQLVGELWEFQGYETTVRQGSSDRGIDIEATKNVPFSETVLIQAKRYGDSNKVGSNEVRNYATLYQQVPEADSVIIVTTGQVTSEAEILATDLDVKTVDFESLYKLIKSCAN